MQGRRRHTGRSCRRKSRWAPAPALAWLPLLRYFDIIWLQHLHSFTGRPRQFHSRGSERKTSPSTLQKTFSIVTNSRVAGWHSGSGAALYKGRCHGIRIGMHKMHVVPTKAASNPHPQDGYVEITVLRARICDNSVASASKRLKGSTSSRKHDRPLPYRNHVVRSTASLSSVLSESRRACHQCLACNRLHCREAQRQDAAGGERVAGDPMAVWGWATSGNLA